MTQLNETIPLSAIPSGQFDHLDSAIVYSRAIPGDEIAPGVINGKWRAYVFANLGAPSPVHQRSADCALGGHVERTRLRRLELLAAMVPLTVLPQRARVLLRSNSPYVVEGINENMARWKRGGWKQSPSRADSPPIEDADLWQTLDGLLSGRELECSLCLDDVTHEMPTW